MGVLPPPRGPETRWGWLRSLSTGKAGGPVSLTAEERARNAKEMRAAREQIDLSDDVLVDRLGYTTQYLQQVLDVDGSPLDVWRTRDLLAALAEHRGQTPPVFTVMTECMRPRAQQWFGRWDLPDIDDL
ncbi:DUF2316 family protein [Actinomyces urogenitalis]